MNVRHVFAIAIATPLFVGCAHPIRIAPDTSKVERTPTSLARFQTTVGYYISPDQLSAEVTTQGGGGDNVRYHPYADLEVGYQKMLSNVFVKVVKLNAPPIGSREANDGINFTIVPTVVTSSGGSGFFTWPPTNFTVDLTSDVRDASGSPVATVRVVGVGIADTSERIRTHGIAGERAMADALVKMQAAMLETKLPSTSVPASTPPKTPAPPIPSAIAERLAQLKDLRDKNLISDAEYEAKRKAILDAL